MMVPRRAAPRRLRGRHIRLEDWAARALDAELHRLLRARPAPEHECMWMARSTMGS
jgi:predicted alpha/beta hydrolase